MQTVKWLNNSVWSIYGTLTDITSAGQSAPGNNGTAKALYVLPNSRLEPCHQMQFNVISKTLVRGGVLALCRDAVGVFYYLTGLFDITWDPNQVDLGVIKSWPWCSFLCLLGHSQHTKTTSLIHKSIDDIIITYVIKCASAI